MALADRFGTDWLVVIDERGRYPAALLEGPGVGLPGRRTDAAWAMPSDPAWLFRLADTCASVSATSGNGPPQRLYSLPHGGREAARLAASDRAARSMRAARLSWLSARDEPIGGPAADASGSSLDPGRGAIDDSG